MKSVVAAVAAVALTAAQDWGTQGTWTQVVPGAGPAGPLGGAWNHAATSAGCFYIVGGDGAGGNATWRFDGSTQQWTQLPDLPAQYRAPALGLFGGNLVLSGGSTTSVGMSNQLITMSTSNWNTNTAWTTVNVGNGPAARNGHRVVIFGGLMFMFGGWDTTQYYNDLWALDLTTTLAAGSGNWVTIAANGATGMPAPRNSFAFETSSSRIVIFGGFYHNVQNVGPWTDCSSPSAQCVWYNDIWVWRPGGVPAGGLQPPANPNTNPGWTQLSTSGGPPAGRFWAATGMISDQLFVYGGQGQGGSLSDLWVFNFVSNAWALVQQSGALPGALGSPAGAAMSHTLWVYNAATPVTGQLWVFMPTGSNGAGGGGGGSTTISTAGLGAGVALAVLISTATLVFTVLLWRGGRTSGSPVPAAGDVYDRL